jgi:NADPH:quinone reductase
MRAIEAETFSGYGGLRQIEMPKPQPAKDRVLVRLTAAGVTPLDHTILSGGHPRAKAPLVLGNEGAFRRTDRRHKLCRQSRPLGRRSLANSA